MENELHSSQNSQIQPDKPSDNAANVMVIDAESTKIYEEHYGPHTPVSQILGEAFKYFDRTRTTELLEVDGTTLTDINLAMELQELRHEMKITGHLTTFTVANGTSGAQYGLS